MLLLHNPRVRSRHVFCGGIIHHQELYHTGFLHKPKKDALNACPEIREMLDNVCVANVFLPVPGVKSFPI